MKFKLKIRLILAVVTMLIVVQCTKEKNNSIENKKPNSTSDSAKIADKNVQDSILKAKEQIRYHAFIFPKKKKDSAMAEFVKKYSENERYLILALNRLDSKNRWRADTLVVPEKIDNNIMAYSPFPVRLDSLNPVKKIAFFSYTIHAYALYENGNLVKWGPSSLGKKNTPTKKGLMFTNWKKEVAISTSNSEWKLRWNFNIHNTAGIGWHQYDLPGFHASHSCLRLLEEDAKWMYDWADQWVLSKGGASVQAKGTPVIVFGESDFKSRPWLNLLSDPHANDISVKEMNSVFLPHLPEILKEQQNSEKVRASKAQNMETSAP